MPTPIDLVLDPISLVALAMYAGLMTWEWLAPGRQLPRVPHWQLRGLSAFALYFLLSSYLPLLWDAHVSTYQLVDLTFLGDGLCTAVGVLVYEVGAWAWHWSLHRFQPLWRMHQTHHSAERLDSFGAFFFHPLDMVGWTALGSFCLVFLVGITPSAATNVILVATFLTIFQHTNVKTPTWLGYFIQRPESHSLHHGVGVHRFNYSDLPLVDLVFGTFRNPAGFDGQTGFYPGASSRTWELLTMRDVSVPHSNEVAGPSSRRPAAVGVDG